MKEQHAPTREMPQADESERGLIASIFCNPNVLDDVFSIVSEDDFRHVPNAMIYRATLDMHQRGVFVEFPAVMQSLRESGAFTERGVFSDYGGSDYVTSLFDYVPTAANATYYAELVREASSRRRLIMSCEQIAAEGYQVSNDFDTLLTLAEELVTKVSDRGRTDSHQDVQDVLVEAMSLIEARMGGKSISGIPTGFIDLDEQLGGLQRGELIILAGRPSMGKSALAANVAEHVAMNSGPVLFVSLEMSRLELAQRMIFARAEVPFHKSRSGFLNSSDMSKLIAAQAEYHKVPLTIDDAPTANVGRIAATARRIGRKKKLALLVIDYLQLVEPDNSRDQRHEQVARLSRRLKGLARELNIPILCLAQLNRVTESVSDHRPRLSHLRESGAIEQDADVVLFCHREVYYATKEEDKERLAGKADIIVAKQRNGPVGDVKMIWRGEFMRFENAADDSFSQPPQRYDGRAAAAGANSGSTFEPDAWNKNKDGSYGRKNA